MNKFQLQFIDQHLKSPLAKCASKSEETKQVADQMKGNLQRVVKLTKDGEKIANRFYKDAEKIWKEEEKKNGKTKTAQENIRKRVEQLDSAKAFKQNRIEINQLLIDSLKLHTEHYDKMLIAHCADDLVKYRASIRKEKIKDLEKIQKYVKNSF